MTTAAYFIVATPAFLMGALLTYIVSDFVRHMKS